MDAILCQTNKAYLLQLIAYNKILQQRNSLLKQGENGASIDQVLLQILNNQLVQSGEFIHQSRTSFLADYIPNVIKLYTEIADNAEGLNLIYDSQLNTTSFTQLLDTNFQKDLILQRTTKGIHRDDLRLELNQHPFKSEGSQGQRKSLLFALKLAEWEYLKENKGLSPILLLDDVFEKLDEKRMVHLMNTVCSSSFGQVFITDTHSNRLNLNLAQTGVSFQLLNL
jgi:DNA replication and repair protein RecF